MIFTAMLNPTPEHLFLDAQSRPYFLWDENLTLEEFEALLNAPDREVSSYYLGKLLRQAKPDDVFRFTSLSRIRAVWPDIERYLGNQRAFWSWLLSAAGKVHGT